MLTLERDIFTFRTVEVGHPLPSFSLSYPLVLTLLSPPYPFLISSLSPCFPLLLPFLSTHYDHEHEP